MFLFMCLLFCVKKNHIFKVCSWCAVWCGCVCRYVHTLLRIAFRGWSSCHFSQFHICIKILKRAEEQGGRVGRYPPAGRFRLFGQNLHTCQPQWKFVLDLKTLLGFLSGPNINLLLMLISSSSLLSATPSVQKENRNSEVEKMGENG